MNIKKKRSLWELLRAALVVILFFGVPVWLLMIALITESRAVCVILLAWIAIPWRCGRGYI